jgi:hypothetical protein
MPVQTVFAAKGPLANQESFSERLISYVQNTGGDGSDKGQNNRESAQPPSPASHSPFVSLVLGFSLLSIAFCCLWRPQNRESPTGKGF